MHRDSCDNFAPMPGANRYILPGHIYHLTHRCHERQFLLRFAKDRDNYRRRLRQAVLDSEASLLTYNITSNHVHLLVYEKVARGHISPLNNSSDRGEAG